MFNEIKTYLYNLHQGTKLSIILLAILFIKINTELALNLYTNGVLLLATSYISYKAISFIQKIQLKRIKIT